MGVLLVSLIPFPQKRRLVFAHLHDHDLGEQCEGDLDPLKHVRVPPPREFSHRPPAFNPEDLQILPDR
jgi:hypothetical protein